ncbi:MAG: hypothetical protein ABIJ09_02430 [Pseudomonadota bacterium]
MRFVTLMVTLSLLSSTAAAQCGNRSPLGVPCSTTVCLDAGTPTPCGGYLLGEDALQELLQFRTSAPFLAEAADRRHRADESEIVRLRTRLIACETAARPPAVLPSPPPTTQKWVWSGVGLIIGLLGGYLITTEITTARAR